MRAYARTQHSCAYVQCTSKHAQLIIAQTMLIARRVSPSQTLSIDGEWERSN